MADESLVAMLERHERAAADALTPDAHDYMATGGGEEVSLRESREAWRRFRIRPHVLRDVGDVRTETDLLGTAVRAPVLVAATALHALAHPDGEVETARGVRAAGGLFVVSSRASKRIEDVVAALDRPWWFQVYFVRDRELTRQLVVRAAAAGARALVLTGDTPIVGRKPRQGNPSVTKEMYLANFGEHLGDGRGAYSRTEQDASITLETIGWLRELTGLPVLVKGVLRDDDAAACIDAGAAGLIVSNHGGRQLDRAIATAAALPDVVSAAGDRVPVLVDGGIRTGVDVLIALALGARAVLIGRPVLWALAADGAAAVAALLDGIRDDLAHVMALAGVTEIAGISRDLIA